MIGDIVLRATHFLSDASEKFNKKLAPKFEGPYRVQTILSPTVFLLQIGDSWKNPKVHMSDFKRFIPPRRVNQLADMVTKPPRLPLPEPDF